MNRKWKKTLVWVLSILILSIPLIAVAIEQQISKKDLSNEYTSVEQTLLEDWGLTPEMTVSQLKMCIRDSYYGVVYYSYEELKSEIERYIKYYNEQRIKEKLGWMSPVQYRLSLLACLLYTSIPSNHFFQISFGKTLFHNFIFIYSCHKWFSL